MLDYHCKIKETWFIQDLKPAFKHRKRQVYTKIRKLTMFITAVSVLFLFKLRWSKNKSLYDISWQFIV